MPVAKCYFADYCSGTTNYILITERIGYGTAPIEPAYRKGRDHTVPEVGEHYRVLAKAQARLVAAHKTGTLAMTWKTCSRSHARREISIRSRSLRSISTV